MGIFDPQGSVQLAPEQSVVDNSSSSLISGLTQGLTGFRGVLNLGGRGGKSASSSKTELNANLFRSIQFSNAKTNPAERTLANHQVITNFLTAGGSLTGDVKTGLENITGQNFTSIGVDPVEIAKNDYRTTKEYANSVIVTKARHPDMSSVEVDSLAIQDHARVVAMETEVKNAKTLGQANWVARGDKAFNDKLSSFTETIHARLTLAGDNINILEEAQKVKVELSALAADLSKPEGVTSEQYTSFKSKLDATQGYLDSLIALKKPTALQAQATARLMSRLNQGDGTPLEKDLHVIGLNNIASNPNTVENSIRVMEVLRKINAGIKADEAAARLDVTPDPLPAVQAQIDGASASDNAQGGIQISKEMGAAAKTGNFSSDPTAIETSLNTSMNMIKAAAGTLSSQGLHDAFNDGTIGLLADSLKTNPTRGKNLKKSYLDTLNAVNTATKRALDVVSGQNNISIDSKGVLSATRGQIVNAIGEKKAALAMATLDKSFGGDINAAFLSFQGNNFVRDAAGGAHLQDPTTDAGGMALANFLSPVLSNMDRLKELTNSLGFINEKVGEIEGMTTHQQDSPASPQQTSGAIIFNQAMKPLLTMKGASKLTVKGADSTLKALISGPLSIAQSSFGSPLTINDGIAKEGTSREKHTPNSRHFHGDAVDISIAGMSDADKLRLVKSLEDAGFQGLGFGTNIIHADLGARRSWAYGNTTFGGQDVNALISAHNSGTQVRPNVPSSVGATKDSAETDNGEGAPTGFQMFSQAATGASSQPVETTVVPTTIDTQGASPDASKALDFNPSNLTKEEQIALIAKLTKLVNGDSGITKQGGKK